MGADRQAGVGNNGQPGNVFRDALRLLFIIVRGGTELATPHDGWDRLFRGEKRALAIDFWLRYPDYLAEQLLDLHAATGDEELLQSAERILREDEPSIRTVRMIRWRRGAFDNLETSLSVLRYRGLAKPMKRQLAGGKFVFEYLTGALARDFLDEALIDQPELAWYERQSALALKVAQDKSGTALKDIHYAEAEYSSTPFGAVIPSITDRVVRRIVAMKGKAA